MIQIVAPNEQIQDILLIELQGKLSIPPKLLSEIQEQQISETEALFTNNNSNNNNNNNNILEVPLGHIENESRNEKRCALRIGALAIEGSRGTYREPLLILKQRKIEENENNNNKSNNNNNNNSSQCCLLEDWLTEHPEELTLSAANTAARELNIPLKIYELKGIVERYVHFNSKPARRAF